ncbi:hypothetical protein ACWGI8_42655 [Streptomyces sp. NPDC054841]
MLLLPENTLFVPGATPALLMAGAPVHDELPALRASGGTVPQCEGWGIGAMLTLCVVDGPGDAGCVVPALGAPVLGGSGNPDDMAHWCSDVTQAGGAVVLSLPELPEVLNWEHLLTSGTSRGGFMPALG